MSVLLELGLRGSLVFLAVVVLDRAIGRRMRSSGRRWWWLLVPLAFLVPVDISLLPAPPLREVVGEQVAALPVLADLRDTFAPPAIVRTRPDWMAVAQWIWLAGASGYVALVLVRTLRVQSRWSELRLSTDSDLLELLEDCKRDAGVRAPIGVIVSPAVGSVAILGWLRPRILIPAHLAATLPRARLRAVLLHELAHFRFADVPATWLFTLARALHWFNPLVHWACAGWIQFREEAADEAAIRWLREHSGQSYGEVILQTLHPAAGAAPFGALGIGESFRHLEQRLLMIRHFSDKAPRWWLCGGVALVLASVTCFPLSRAGALPEPTAPDETIWTAPKTEVSVPASVLRDMVGRYDYLSGVLTVTLENDRLFAQLGGQPKWPIYPKSESVFFWKGIDAQVAFLRNDRGEVVSAMHHQAGNTMIAPRLVDIPVATIDPAILDDYVGRYRPRGFPAILTVSREGDRLFVQMTGQPKIGVWPKSETEFFLREVHAILTFVRSPDGKVIKVVNRQAGQTIEMTREE